MTITDPAAALIAEALGTDESQFAILTGAGMAAALLAHPRLARVVALGLSAEGAGSEFGHDGPRILPATCTHYCEGGHFDGDAMTMVGMGRR